MTQINFHGQPEIMGWGWKMPSIGSIGKAIAAPITGTVHATMEVGRGIRDGDVGRIVTAPIRGAGTATGDVIRGTTGIQVNTASERDIKNQRQANIRNSVAKISGSNYAAVLPHLNEAMKNYQALSGQYKTEMHPVYKQGYEKGRQAYIQNADTLMNLYRSYLTSNNPQEVTAAVQNYTLDIRALMDSKHPTGNTKAVQEKDQQMNNLLTDLQTYGQNLSSTQVRLAEEQVRQQGAIIDYETQQAAGGAGNLMKYLIPAGLGIGAIMLLKG